MSVLLDVYLKVRNGLKVEPLVEEEDLDLAELVHQMDLMLDITEVYNELFERMMQGGPVIVPF